MAQDPEVIQKKLLIDSILSLIFKSYMIPLREHVKQHPELIEKIPGFLIKPDKICLYINKQHVGIEYIGKDFIDLKELDDDIPEIDVSYKDFTRNDKNILPQIIGFKNKSDTTSPLEFPVCPGLNSYLFLATNRGWDKLSELGWNFAAQGHIAVFNSFPPVAVKNIQSRLANCFFFDSNDTGLITRNIKWLEIIPIFYEDCDDSEIFKIPIEAVENLFKIDKYLEYSVPNDYKFKLLPKINRFIELWGNKNTTEPQITSFLACPENEFILTMRFGGVKIHAERLCEWQSHTRPNIKPDFFIEHSDGYADIVEFKLPNVANPVVGKTNREAFAFWVHSYIAQTRVYEEFFEDPKNRNWFEQKYGFKVKRPRRWLVVGRRTDFDAEVWRDIMADYRNINIITFDDLVDSVTAQFYKA